MFKELINTILGIKALFILLDGCRTTCDFSINPISNAPSIKAAALTVFPYTSFYENLADL